MVVGSELNLEASCSIHAIAFNGLSYLPQKQGKCHHHYTKLLQTFVAHCMPDLLYSFTREKEEKLPTAKQRAYWPFLYVVSTVVRKSHWTESRILK